MEDYTFQLTALLLIGMPCAMELGRRVRLARERSDAEGAENGGGALDAAVYALFGLLLAFVFSGAAGRFDHRRELIVQEANAIGTAYLRLDLLSPSAQGGLRPMFRDYLESRLETYRRIDDPEAALAELQRSIDLQNRIWKLAVEGARDTGSPAVLSLLLPALNEMIDITTTRLAATRTHPPVIIYAMLVIVAFASSFLAGMAMARSRRRPLPHILAFTLVISATVYMILDIEHPRRGFIRLNAADQPLLELLDSLQRAPSPLQGARP